MVKTVVLVGQFVPHSIFFSGKTSTNIFYPLLVAAERTGSLQ